MHIISGHHIKCRQKPSFGTTIKGVPLQSAEIQITFIIRYICNFFLTFKLGLFGTLKLALALQFIVTNAYFSVARMLTLVLHATLK